jgi:hypothetical protein
MIEAYQFWDIYLWRSKFNIENSSFGWIKTSAVEWWELAGANDLFNSWNFEKVITMIGERNDDIVW